MKRLSLVIFAMFFTIGIFLESCEEKDQNLDSGKISLSITDAPFDISLVEEATITIEQIEIRSKDSIEGSPYMILLEEAVEVSLLDLTNGVTERLLEVEVPVGEYDLIRLKISESSLKLINGTVFDLKVPSGNASGLKIFIEPSITVQGGLTSELLLDMDVSRSFIPKGNIEKSPSVQGFNFKPVIRAVNLSTSGRVTGYVVHDEDSVIEDANVWIESDTIVSTTYSDSTGYYALIGIPEGIYDLYSYKEGFDTTKVADVNVVASNKSEIDLQLNTPTE